MTALTARKRSNIVEGDAGMIRKMYPLTQLGKEQSELMNTNVIGLKKM